MKTFLCLCVLLVFLFSFSKRVNEPLKLDPANRHYFQYNGKPVILITSGEHYGALINLDFDYTPYLDSLGAQGLNNTRVFSGTYVERGNDIKWMGSENTLAPRLGRLIAPWARSNVKGYLGGGNKFDLDQWNDKYFQRLRDLLTQAKNMGVFVELTLFGNQYGDFIWMNSPLYPENNIQHSGPEGPGSFRTFETLGNKDLLDRQDKFVEKILHELNGFDNLYYEICNEPFNDVTDSLAVIKWHNHMIDLITKVESSLPKRHLIATNQAAVDNINVSVANYHYVEFPNKPSDDWICGLNKVYSMDETMGSLIDSDVDDVRVEAWDFFLRGGGAYNNLCWEYTPDNESGSDSARIIRIQLESLKNFMNTIDYVKMSPDKNSVVKSPVGAFVRVLSEKGKEYAIYLHHSKPKGNDPVWGYDAIEKTFKDTLFVRIPTGKYVVKYTNPSSCKLIDDSDTIESNGGQSMLITPSFNTDIAFVIRRQ